MARKDHNTDGDEKKSVSLYDFYIPEKVTAFARKYSPVEEQNFSTEVFNEERLREFFKAYVFPLGDPLKLYIEDLQLHGFDMSVSITGEPAILVNEKFN